MKNKNKKHLSQKQIDRLTKLAGYLVLNPAPGVGITFEFENTDAVPHVLYRRGAVFSAFPSVYYALYELFPGSWELNPTETLRDFSQTAHAAFFMSCLNDFMGLEPEILLHLFAPGHQQPEKWGGK